MYALVGGQDWRLAGQGGREGGQCSGGNTRASASRLSWCDGRVREGGRKETRNRRRGSVHALYQAGRTQRESESGVLAQPLNEIEAQLAVAVAEENASDLY